MRHKMKRSEVPSKPEDAIECVGLRANDFKVFDKNECRWRYKNGVLWAFIEYSPNYEKDGHLGRFVRIWGTKK